MLELSRNARLVEESADRARAVQQVVTEDLDGDLAVESRVVGAINHTHSAAGQFVGDLKPGDLWESRFVSARRRGIGNRHLGQVRNLRAQLAMNCRSFTR